MQGQIAAYEQKLQEELEQQDDQALPDEDCPVHPNPAKEKAIRARGEQTVRTTLYRYAGADLTRIDCISAGAARTIITEIGPDLAAFPTEKHFVSWLGLAPRHAVSGGKPLPGKQRGRGMGATPRLERPVHGRDLADPIHVRAGCRAAPQGAAQGDEDGDFRHRAQVGDVGVPHAVLGARLRRRGRGGL